MASSTARGAVVMTRLRADAGLELVRAFMNTLVVDEGVDELRDAAAFGAWLVSRGLPRDPDGVSEQDLASARRLRSAFRRLARHHAGPLEADAIDELNVATSDVGVGARFTAEGEVALTGSATGTRGALGALLAAVAVAFADGSWTRVKVCDNDACAFVFYDSSRNRAARWCTMAVCGNRIKARAFRERHQRDRPVE
jgi:predicted RNA-binding Zn ribbon-like protein